MYDTSTQRYSLLFFRLISKIKMGKRIEKALGKEKGQTSSASNEGQEDDPNRTPGNVLNLNTSEV